ncbi:MAG: polysaccharide biosynthesis C-terminal domain-containing protein [Phycisphaerales bacterium]|nr:polysaccharide biosynthesis C-terminal domain-containing protein [Phycisphaerales bacterium]
MGIIRKQAISNVIITYIGFIIGACTTFLFTSKNLFTPEQYGLTRVMLDLGINIASFATLSTPGVISKFYPYYNDRLPKKDNDQLLLGVITTLCLFIIITSICILMRDFIIRKIGGHSPLLIQYYNGIFLIAFGLALYKIFEIWLCCILNNTEITTFLQEILLRIFTVINIAMYLLHFINFNTFIYIFSVFYLTLTIGIIIYLIKIKGIPTTLHVSKVTKRLKYIILKMQLYISSGMIIGSIATTIEAIAIASLINLSAAGIFTLASYMASLIQVSQRGISGISGLVLIRAWKDKNFKEVEKIYKSSCINMLLFALFIFGNITLNIQHLYRFIGTNTAYLQGSIVFVILGIGKVIDAGTGINDVIISASHYWKFQFWSGLLLMALLAPFNYFLVKEVGINGAALAQVISFIIYNFIRFEFIRRKLNLQPFGVKNLLALILFLACFFVTYFGFRSHEGFLFMLIRSTIYSALFIAGILALQLTKDAHELLGIVINKIRDKIF